MSLKVKGKVPSPAVGRSWDASCPFSVLSSWYLYRPVRCMVQDYSVSSRFAAGKTNAAVDSNSQKR